MTSSTNAAWSDRLGRTERAPIWHAERWSARLTSLVAFSALAVLAAIVFWLTSHWITITREGLNQQAHEQMARTSAAIVERVRDLLSETEDMARRVARVARTMPNAAGDTVLLDLLGAELSAAGEVENIFIGYPDGRFLRVGRVPPHISAVVPQAREMRQRFGTAGAFRRAEWEYRSESGEVLLTEDLDDGFDPRIRPWFVLAAETKAAAWTEPYTFWVTGRPGVTFALPMADGAVIGVDVRLDRLAEFVVTLAPDPTAEIAIVDHLGGSLSNRADLISTEGRGDGLVLIVALGPASLAELWAQARLAAGAAASIEQGARVGVATPIPVGSFTWTVLATIPRHVFLGRLDILVERLAWLSGGIAVAAAMLVLILSSFARRAWDSVLTRLRALDHQPEPEPAAALASESERAHSYIDRIRAARERDLQSLGEARVVLSAMAGAITNLSHELRTPTGLVIANAEALRLGIAGALPPMAVTMIETIEAGGNQLNAHIEQIVAYAELRAEVWQRPDATVDVSTLVRTTMTVMQDIARQRDVDLVLAVEDGLVATIDGDRLRRALTHLLANSIVYAGARTMVAIIAVSGESEIQICVSDSGRGLDPEEAKLALEPFLRPGYDRWIAAPPSLGLGIAMADEQMRLIGGALTLTSAKDFGMIALLAVPKQPLDSA